MIRPAILAETIRRLHPLHRLRKLRLFQAISRGFDPMIPWRLSILPRPIYLRVLSHGSFLLGASSQESSIRETLTAILRSLPSDNRGAFWDVGANIGYFTWSCAALRPDFEIVSFEPDSKNIECLKRTSRRWNLRRHVIMPCAVAEHSGRAAFFLDNLSGATGTLEESQNFNLFHYGCTPEQTEVETISLDDFLGTRTHPPSVIKIDVEGAELRVLEGGSSLIAQRQPILFLETFRHRDEIAAFFEAHGYRAYDSDRRQRIGAETINFVAVVPERWPGAMNVLRELGYPS